MSQEVYNVNVTLANGTLAVGTTVHGAFFAPADGVGGGITIVKCDYFSNNAIGAGSAPNYTLITTSSAGVVNGTAVTAIGSAAFGAGTARPGTVASAFVDGGYGVAVKAAQTAANADSLSLSCAIQYKMGR